MHVGYAKGFAIYAKPASLEPHTSRLLQRLRFGKIQCWRSHHFPGLALFKAFLMLKVSCQPFFILICSIAGTWAWPGTTWDQCWPYCRSWNLDPMSTWGLSSYRRNIWAGVVNTIDRPIASGSRRNTWDGWAHHTIQQVAGTKAICQPALCCGWRPDFTLRIGAMIALCNWRGKLPRPSAVSSPNFTMVVRFCHPVKPRKLVNLECGFFVGTILLRFKPTAMASAFG